MGVDGVKSQKSSPDSVTEISKLRRPKKWIFWFFHFHLPHVCSCWNSGLKWKKNTRLQSQKTSTMWCWKNFKEFKFSNNIFWVSEMSFGPQGKRFGPIWMYIEQFYENEKKSNFFEFCIIFEALSWFGPWDFLTEYRSCGFLRNILSKEESISISLTANCNAKPQNVAF